MYWIRLLFYFAGDTATVTLTVSGGSWGSEIPGGAEKQRDSDLPRAYVYSSIEGLIRWQFEIIQ